MSKISELITKVRYRLVDISDESYSNAALMAFINQGANIFALKTGALQYKDDISVSAGQQYAYFDYSGLAANPITVFAVWHEGLPLVFAEFEDMKDIVPTSGTPTVWSTWGETILLDKTLLTGDALIVFYTHTPVVATAVTDDFEARTGVAFPAKWEDAIVAYAAYRARSADRETGLADRAMAEFNDAVMQANPLINSQLIHGGVAPNG